MKKLPNIPWPSVFGEGLIIVVSILLAFWIQAWWEDRAQANDEEESLVLIQRDLEAGVELLNSHMEFSRGAADSALFVYEALSGPGPYDRDRIHHALVRVDRTTLRVPKAAYTDLLSTGNLRIIQDRELRDAIVRYYESVERAELFLAKNNDVFLDRQLLGTYFGQGLVLAHTTRDIGDQPMDEVHELIRERLSEDFVHPPDPMWGFQQDSREWQILRALLLNAAQIHVIGETVAEEQIIAANELLESIERSLQAR